MTFKVYRSQRDPNFHIITDGHNEQRALVDYRQSNPGDQLQPLVHDDAQEVLGQVPDQDMVKSFIDMIGYYGHSAD